MHPTCFYFSSQVRKLLLLISEKRKVMTESHGRLPHSKALLQQLSPVMKNIAGYLIARAREGEFIRGLPELQADHAPQMLPRTPCPHSSPEASLDSRYSHCGVCGMHISRAKLLLCRNLLLTALLDCLLGPTTTR